MFEMSCPPIVRGGIVSLLVCFLNPMYSGPSSFVDRAFFRQRYDAQQTVDRAWPPR